MITVELWSMAAFMVLAIGWEALAQRDREKERADLAEAELFITDMAAAKAYADELEAIRA